MPRSTMVRPSGTSRLGSLTTRVRPPSKLQVIWSRWIMENIFDSKC
ncbi:MAG: hypothetical protein ACYTEV_00035 [Planctomycetota bacterium]